MHCLAVCKVLGHGRICQPFRSNIINMHRKIILSILFIGILCSNAQNRQTRLENYFTALAKNRQFNGNVLIAEGGKIMYQASFGIADPETRRLNTANSVFPIMSITKTFTATAILQLQERGKLKVTDFVQQHLPDFPYPTITIRHLLSHTSGLPSCQPLFDSLRLVQPQRIFTNADILPRYKAVRPPLKYPPGNSGNYDNINYILLAILIEKVSDVPFHHYVQTNILDRSGMTGTIFPEINFIHYNEKERANLSMPYYYPHVYSDELRTAENSLTEKFWHNYNFMGFGEMLSTTEDLLKYDQALYNGKLLRQETLDEPFQAVHLNNGNDNPVGYGLGWHIQQDATYGATVLHGGGGMGLSAVLLRNIDKRQTVIIIDNNHGQDGLFVNGMARDAIKIMNGEPVRPIGRSVAREYGKILVTMGGLQARNFLENALTDTVMYSTSEEEFNALGYDLLKSDKVAEAIESFKVNTQLFPASWNVYDSYGEALLKDGNTKAAIEMYKKSVELNPDNIGGKRLLERLSK
jgi:CubicO group peptidase (beta-lactamase class C family)